MRTWTRRDFLKGAGAAAIIPWLKPLPPDTPEPLKPIGLGRVTESSIWAYRDPKPGATKESPLKRDTVVEIYDAISTEGLMRHNPIWNLTRFGWAYSSWVQPVERRPNPIVRDVPETGFWAQVSIPYAEMRSKPNDKAFLLYRLYYSSVHLVIARIEDELGQSWYQLRDDQYLNAPQYVRAEGLRLISPQAMTPLSPGVEDKRIEIDTGQQMIYAFEGDTLVFSTQCSTGAVFNVDGLGLVDFTTPRGEFTVIRKRPRRHMMGFQERSDGYDLPGVPFPTYFTASGVAIHGAYWHNDFGRARSHGCVNVRPEAALWFYRWTRPIAAYEDALLEVKEGGTPITVT
jgi:lipoprotein-anchoring transpeptidase ErfK/SrfK